MWSYFPELLERAVPRYTSFPTAAEFRPLEQQNVIEENLSAIPAGSDVSLYLHIPYCNEICHYCACNTGRANRKKRLQSYLDALHREIGLVGGHLTGPVNVRRIAFGGGSPNAIAPDEFALIVEQLAKYFDIKDTELSVELDPRDFTEDWAIALGRVGATHASMGVQTFAPHVQDAIGRIQPSRLIAKAVEQLRANGIASINFDMMYGLPGQTGMDLADSLKQAIDLRPDRIALFGYAHLPDRIPRQRCIDTRLMANQTQRFAMSALGYRNLLEAGYQAIGFDHFALPDDPMAKASRSGKISRNFQGYTDDSSPYLIGLGASAISIFPDQILQNAKNVGAYRNAIFDGRIAPSLGIRRTRQDKLRARIIEDILCRGKADLGEVADSDGLAEAIKPFEERKLIRHQNRQIICNESATPYLRTIAAIFDPYRTITGPQFSNAI